MGKFPYSNERNKRKKFMQNLNEFWQQVCNLLQQRVTAVSFDLWIKSLEPVEEIDGVVYLSTTSETAKNRVEKLHSEHIKQAITEVNAELKGFKVLDPMERDEFVKKQTETVSPETAAVAPLFNFNPKYTFENFVVGNSNKYVYAAAYGVAEHPFSKINPLFIYGGVGLGKTHLLHAIGNHLRKNDAELKVLYVTCEKFTNDYVESLRSSHQQAISKYREKYRNVDVLMVDDIQFISNKTGTQEEFFHTFNDLYQNGKQIIIASDRPPKEISSLEERLKSRFSMGLIQDIQTPDFETRLAILQKKAQQEHYLVDEKVINFIAEQFDSNIRELEGMLSKVCFYASLMGQKTATLEIVEEALKDSIVSNKQTLTSESILDSVCKYFSVEKDDIIGKKKNKEIVEPRQIAMYLMYDMLDLPLTSIGQLFGGRDHTTVMHAREKVTLLIKSNNRIKVIINDLKSMANRS